MKVWSQITIQYLCSAKIRMELQSRLLTVLWLALLSTFIRGLPVDDARRAAEDQAHDYHKYDLELEDDSTVFLPVPKAPKPKGCTMNVTTTYNMSEYSYNPETEEIVMTLVEVNRTAEDCCEGWGGDDCDIEKRPANHPCGNLTCKGHPSAQCALIKRCGIEIPLFVDDLGRVVKNCLSEEHLCMGICKTDPCDGLSCERYPEAMCFTSGCSCEPVWVLPTKARVSDCSLDPSERKVRQAPEQCQS